MSRVVKLTGSGLALGLAALACVPQPETLLPPAPQPSAAMSSDVSPASPQSLPQPLPQPTVPPLSAANLLANGGVEQLSSLSASLPEAWSPDSWGELNASLHHVKAADAFSGQHYLAVEIRDYVSGDAKWVPEPQTLTPDRWYQYRTLYRSDGRNRLIWSCAEPEGRRRFYTLWQSHASAQWRSESFRFYVSPALNCASSLMHVVDREGWLHSDHHSLEPVAAAPLQRPLVSISFDDIWASAAEAGAAELDARGWKGSFYIAGNFARSGEAAHANPEQIRALIRQGHEIGSHSETHALMTSLNPDRLISELRDHRQYLEWLGAKPQGMAYPFGDFDREVEIETQRFHAYARTSLTGLNDRHLDPYRLKILPVTAETTTAELKRWADDAQRTSTWLILLFHDLNDTPGDYFYTSGLSQYREFLDYLAQRQLTVLPVAEALAEVQRQQRAD